MSYEDIERDQRMWDCISASGALTEEYMRAHEDDLNWNIIVQHQVLPEYLIEEYIGRKISYMSLCGSHDLSEGFLLRHAGDICWSDVLERQKFSSDFLEKTYGYYDNTLGWFILCHYQDLSDDFMRKHVDKLSWSTVSYRQHNMSEEFVYEFAEKLDISNVRFFNQGKYSQEFIDKCQAKKDAANK